MPRTLPSQSGACAPANCSRDLRCEFDSDMVPLPSPPSEGGGNGSSNCLLPSKYRKQEQQHGWSDTNSVQFLPDSPQEKTVEIAS
jgi:hypothetical protein